MVKVIDNAAFSAGHDRFLNFEKSKSGGIPFVDFQHKFFVDDELRYKWRVWDTGTQRLSLGDWGKWKPGSGKILDATKAACSPEVSQNLLEHRYGSRHGSASPLYRVESRQQVEELEDQLRLFLLGSDRPSEFGPRFDVFAEFLRGNRLGCKWSFLAYLAFLLNREAYFPVMPERFGNLLRFYGIDTELAGKVEWRRYEALLQLAEILKERLALYGTADMLDVQSYMWVVSHLISTGPVSPVDPDPIDADAELRKRQARAAEHERVGLWGERFVAEQERERLRAAGRSDLAKLVCWASVESSTRGYDVLSFDESGRRLYIEVKSTSRRESSDAGFFLSEGERELGEIEESWTVFRVWGVPSSMTFRDLGNIVRDVGSGWSLSAAAWLACNNDIGQAGGGRDSAYCSVLER